MSGLSINYDLGRNGWSNFVISCEERELAVGPFSYLTDALGDLVRAALMLAASGEKAQIRLHGEPQEWRLIVDEGWTELIRLSVRQFDDFDENLPETDGRLLFEIRVPADGFASAVQRVAQGVWDSYGATGYNERWGGSRGFPLRGLLALSAALAHDEPGPD